MTHDIRIVTKFDIVGDYTLAVYFGDGTSQVIDFWPLLRGQLYSPLRDLDMFNQVHLNLDEGTLAWPNGADFDPATLHDWKEVGPAMVQMTAAWPVVAEVKNSESQQGNKPKQEVGA